MYIYICVYICVSARAYTDIYTHMIYVYIHNKTDIGLLLTVNPQVHSGVNLRANLRSISPRCHLLEVAFVWELTKEIIYLPLDCLQGGSDATSPHDPTNRLSSKDRNNYPPVQISRIDGHGHLFEGSVKVKFNSEVGRFGFIVRAGGSYCRFRAKREKFKRF